MTMDKTAERQRLDDAIRTAESAGAYLADLERQRAELPALKAEKKRLELERAVQAQMDHAQAQARKLLTEAGATLTEGRRAFTEICAAGRVLAEKMAEAERQIFAALDLVSGAVEAEAFARLAGDPRLAGHAGERARFMAVSGRFGELWPALGGTLVDLLAFPETASSLQSNLLAAIRTEVYQAIGGRIYHPGAWNDWSPFKLQL